jgi:hypothetical protein
MGLLTTTPSGLEHLAANCGTWAGDVAVASMPEVSSAARQPSAAAAETVHARLGLSGEELSGRMATTAAKLAITAGTFTAQDQQSSALLTSVAPDI